MNRPISCHDRNGRRDRDGGALRPRRRDGERQGAVRRQGHERERRDRRDAPEADLRRLRPCYRVPVIEKGFATRAEPKVSSETAPSKIAVEKMRDATAKLDLAAKSGNLDAIKAAVGETGKSCKACHDRYRREAPSSLPPGRAPLSQRSEVGSLRGLSCTVVTGTSVRPEAGPGRTAPVGASVTIAP
ncbi:MAG: cytochrome c [Burkholderiaceae bacterium]